MLTLEDTVEWEQLTGKKLQDFDTSCAEDVVAMGYVQHPQRREYTLEQYRDALINSNTKELERVVRAAAAEFAYIAQFKSRDDEIADEDKNSESVTAIVGQLITSGIDGAFLLSRGLEDLRWLTIAAHEAEKRRIEDARFWTYIKLSPYIDRKKVNDVKEFLPLSWERAGNSTITELEKKMARALFKTK